MIKHYWMTMKIAAVTSKLFDIYTDVEDGGVTLSYHLGDVHVRESDGSKPFSVLCMADSILGVKGKDKAGCIEFYDEDGDRVWMGEAWFGGYSSEVS